MWQGGVRVILQNEEGKLLLACQRHEGREIWMPPGGAIEAGEDAKAAAKREMLEETGLEVEIGNMLWHVEEVSPARGQRFVLFFLARMTQKMQEAKLGSDPELAVDAQVLESLAYFAQEEVAALPNVYPAMLRDELWELLERCENAEALPEVFRIRK